MYSMNACIGSCFAGLVEKSHARFSFIASNESLVGAGFFEEVDFYKAI
jgi:hypothetical protein